MTVDTFSIIFCCVYFIWVILTTLTGRIPEGAVKKYFRLLSGGKFKVKVYGSLRSGREGLSKSIIHDIQKSIPVLFINDLSSIILVILIVWVRQYTQRNNGIYFKLSKKNAKVKCTSVTLLVRAILIGTRTFKTDGS